MALYKAESNQLSDHRGHISAEYYQSLHNTNPAFMNNNWLVDELELIRKLAGNVSTVLELGCGNGRFLELAAGVWPTITGIDWARSAHLDKLLKTHTNIRFIQTDIATLKFEEDFDLIVSADFLEHLPNKLLGSVIMESLRWGNINFHKIACYDDGHSHLSILQPEEWLLLFNSQPGGEDIRIVSTEHRKGNPKNIVITLSNGMA